MPAEAQIGAAVRAGLVPHTVDGVGDGLLTALAATDPDRIIARLDLPQPGPDLPPHPGTLNALYDRLRHEHGQVPEPGMMAWLLGARIDLIESDGAVTPVPAPDGLVDPPTLTLLRVTDAAAGSRYHATQPLGLPLDTLDAAWVQHTLDTLSPTAAAEHWAQSIEDFRDNLTRLGYTDLATTPPIAVYHLALRLIALQRAAATPPTPTTLTDPAVWTTQPPTPHPAPDRTLEHPPITRTFTADGHGDIPGITLAGEPVTMGAAAAHRQVTLHLGPRDDTTLAAHAAITDRKGTTWYHTLNPPTPHEYQTIKTHGTVWSKPVDPNAIPGHGNVSRNGVLSVAGQLVRVGNRSAAGPVTYWYNRSTVWVEWPDGRRRDVEFKHQLSDQRWQKLRQPRGGVGGWSSQPGADAIAGTGTVTSGGQLSVAGQRVYVGRTLGGESTTGKVEYRFDQQTVWVKWPDGRRKEVKFTNKLSDERWQKLRQPGGGVGGATRQEPGGGVGGWSSQPGADAIPGTGTVAPDGQLTVAGQRVSVGKTLDGKSTAGKVEYRFDQQHGVGAVAGPTAGARRSSSRTNSPTSGGSNCANPAAELVVGPASPAPTRSPARAR